MNEQFDIILNNVSFSYNKKCNVIQDACFNISKKDFSAIIGPNGGGKTTLLKLILGLLMPDAGEIILLNKSPKTAVTDIGYVPQFIQFDMQFPITVLDVVLMGRLGNSFRGRYNKQDIQIAKQSLEEVHLLDYENELFSNISGGQRQRVLIARALCCNPKILMLDEPTSNVDLQAEQDLLEILKKLNTKMTILLVSHDIGFVSSAVKNVICVNNEVRIHPTSKVSGHVIQELYNNDMHMVHHDHCCNHLHKDKTC